LAGFFIDLNNIALIADIALRVSDVQWSLKTFNFVGDSGGDKKDDHKKMISKTLKTIVFNMVNSMVRWLLIRRSLCLQWLICMLQSV